MSVMRGLILLALVLACARWTVSVRRPAGGTTKLFLQPKLVNILPREFLSFAIDDDLAKKNWSKLDFGSARLRTLVKALQPAVLRFGGTNADCLIFQRDVEAFRGTARCNPYQKRTTPFQLTESSWSPLREFVSTLRLPLLFDLNSLLRDEDGRWNDTNARDVITTLRAELPAEIIWQLGNEPNSYQHKFNYSVPPETLGEDFLQLRRLLGPDDRLVGPDVNRPKLRRPAGLQERPVDMSGQRFISRFLETGRDAVDAVTFHQYYFDGRTATAEAFTNTTYMDLLARQIGAARRAVAGLPVELWITETGSAWGGGAAGLSDRYLAGFLWLDKLGVAARHGVSLVVRQALYGGHYSLLDDDMRPNPDYWLSYLYKLVMGRRVLHVSMSGPASMRMYCHCEHKFLPADSVSCFTLNLSKMPQKIKLDRPLRHGGIVYMMTPPDGNLTSQNILCNGQLLQLQEDSLPPIPTALMPAGPTLTLPPYGIGFHVFRRAAPASCQGDAKLRLRTESWGEAKDWD